MKAIVKLHLILFLFITSIYSGFAQSVTITSPTGAEELKFGDPLTITWENGQDIPTDRFWIYYQVDGGSLNTILSNTQKSTFTNEGATSSYDWVVPDLLSNLDAEVTIRVLNNTQSVQDDSEPFRVYYESSVSIVSPTGAEELKFGDPITISWENGDDKLTDRIYLYYLVDGGSLISIVANAQKSTFANEGETSSYDWVVPDLLSNIDAEVTIRVLNNTRNVQVESEPFRAYYESSVSIVSPTGAEELKFGDPITISWENGDDKLTDRIYLYYLVDGGSLISIVANAQKSTFTNEGETSSYDWVVPDLLSNIDAEVTIRVLNNTRNVQVESEPFRAYYESSVSIVSPTGAEELKFGDPITISWENGDDKLTDRFWIYYQVDGGSLNTILSNTQKSTFTNEGATSSYDWVVPDLLSNLDAEVTIRVLNNTRNIQSNSEPFRVYYESSVSIVSPTGLEELKFGDPLTISWENGDDKLTDRFWIYYQVDGGSLNTILSNTQKSTFTNEGVTSSYDWVVPDLLSNLDAEVTIRVLNNTRNVQNNSEPFRAYYESSIDIISPPFDQFLASGSTVTISWENGDDKLTDRFWVYYQVDGGSLNTILSNTQKSTFTNDGTTSSYEWTVPNIESTDAKIRILNNTRNITSTSVSFTVCSTCPGVAIYSPNGGEVYAVGDNAEIGWNINESSWGATDNVTIEFSQDGGSTFESTALYNGQYDPISANKLPLVIPDILTDQGLVKITNTTSGDTDVSNATFKIVKGSLLVPTNVFAFENTNGTVTINWTDNEDAEVGYKIQYATDNSNWLAYNNNIGADVETYTTNFLTQNIPYWWRVVTYNELVESLSTSKFAANYNPPGNALNFDGVNNSVSLQDPNAFSFGTGDFTMELWANISDLSNTRVLISDYNGTTSGSIGFVVEPEGNLAAYIGSNTYDISTPIDIIKVGSWYHLSLVKSGDNAYIYVNGIEEANASGLGARSLVSSVNMSLGSQPSGAPFYFNGQMDEVSIWNVARTSTEIANNLYLEKTGTETGLVAYYKFDQSGSSTVLPDRTINGLDGVVNTGGNQANWVSSNALAIEAQLSFVGVDVAQGIEFLDVDATSKDASEISYQVSGQYLQGNVQLSVFNTGGASNHPGFDISLDQSTYSTNASILQAEAVEKDVFVRAIVPANNGRTYLGKITHSTTAGQTVEIPVSVTELFQEATIAISSPEDNQITNIGEVINLEWTTTNMANEAIQVSYSTDGENFITAVNLNSNSSSYSFNTFSFDVGPLYIKVAAPNLPTPVSDVVVVQLQNTVLTLESPNGGEVWTTGTEQTISWVTENIEPTDLIDIQLSTNNGFGYSSIADGTFDTYPNNTFTWTIPDLPTNQAFIRVVNTTSGQNDRSDVAFTISNPAISLITPQGGEFWEIGTQQLIRWTDQSFNSSDLIEIRISRDGGDNYEIISEGFWGINYPSKQISWEVVGPASDNVMVQIANTTKNVIATTAEPFEIGTVTRSLTVTSPNGGEIWMQQNPVTITWESEGMLSNENIRIELSTDGGITFPGIIVNSTFGQFPDNTFTWSSVGLEVTQTAILKITNFTQNVSDVSDAVFSVVPAADVTAPQFNSQPLASIGNQNFDITVNMNEAGVVYYVGLADGSSIPTAEQVKQASEENPLEGQIVSGTFSYENINTAQSVNGSGDFIIDNLYDFYFTAEDVEGNLNPGFSRPNVRAIRIFTPLELDSIELRKIYDQMGGENWTGIVNDWTDEENAITEWDEIVVSGEQPRVTGVNLAGKGLVGSMPQSASQMNALSSLDLSDNAINFVADFSEVSSMTTMNLSNNNLTFASIVPHLGIETFSYIPQQPIELIGGNKSDTLFAGSNILLSSPFLGSGVIYQWEYAPIIPGKGFGEELLPIEGATAQNYLVQDLNIENQGTYKLTATHPDSRLETDFSLDGLNQFILGKEDISGTIRSNGTAISGGEIFIYRQTPEGPFAKEDSTLVGNNGFYSINDVILGNFIVQVKPDRESNETSIQTYYISAESYDDADTLVLDSRRENIDIDLLFYEPGLDNPEGASIGGIIETDFADDEGDGGGRINGRRKVRKAGCSMRRFKTQGRPDQDEAETEIAYYIETDDEGFFNFTGVDYGRYLIQIEFPGVPMDNTSEVEFFIDPEKTNQVFEVSALIDELGIRVTTNEILFTMRPYVKDIVLYPNPTDGVLAMEYTVNRDISDLKIEVADISGRVVLEQAALHIKGRHHMVVDLTDLTSGVYFMIITDGAGTFQEQLKLSRK